MVTLGKLRLVDRGKGCWESKRVKVESTNAIPLGLEAQHHLEVRLEMTAIISLKILPSVDKSLGPMLALQKAPPCLLPCVREGLGSVTSLLTLQGLKAGKRPSEFHPWLSRFLQESPCSSNQIRT